MVYPVTLDVNWLNRMLSNFFEIGGILTTLLTVLGLLAAALLVKAFLSLTR